MNCPDCGHKMESENAPVVIPPKGLTSPPTLRGGSHYRCENCDSEWSWVQFEGLVKVDSADGKLYPEKEQGAEG